MADELNVVAELEHVYRFCYQASFGDVGSEHESCHVFLGRLHDPPVPNASEVDAVRFVSLAELDEEMASRSDRLTPWLKLEWAALKTDYRAALARYT